MKERDHYGFSMEYPKIRCVRMLWDTVTRRYRYESAPIGDISNTPVQTPVYQLKNGDIAMIGSYYDDGPTPFLAIMYEGNLYCSEQQETWKVDDWRLLYEFLSNDVHPKRAIEMIEL